MEASPPILVFPHREHHHGVNTLGIRGGIAIVVGSIFAAMLSMCMVALCVWMCGIGSGGSGGDEEQQRQQQQDQQQQQQQQQGLSLKAIEMIPKVSFAALLERGGGGGVGGGDVCCPVCLSEFQASDNTPIWLMPQCNHSFHEDCIRKWLATHISCPVCRVNITEPLNKVEP